MQMNIVTKIPTLLAIAQKAIATDLRAEEMVQLGRLGLEIERDRVKTVVVDATYATPFLGPNGENLLMPSRQAIQQAILRAFNEATGQTARVEVLNGTDRVGVARQVADQLARVGLRSDARRRRRPQRLPADDAGSAGEQSARGGGARGAAADPAGGDQGGSSAKRRAPTCG